MTAFRIAVVGGGITGLAAALHLLDLGQAHATPLEVTVLEAGSSLGGKVRTDRPGRFIIEQGPDSLLARKPWGVDLCRRLGLGDQLTGPGPLASRSYLATGDGLEPMPPGLVLGVPTSARALLSSRLVPFPGRLRAALEPWIPPRRTGSGRGASGRARGEDVPRWRRGVAADESLHEFLSRRLGRMTAEAVAEPLLEAVHAGDARRLSARATYPQLVALEERYGSLTRGLQRQRQAPPGAGSQGAAPGTGAAPGASPGGATQRSASQGSASQGSASQGAGAPGGSGPAGAFATLRTGLGSLAERAVEVLRGNSAVRLLTGRRVTLMEPLRGGRWAIVTGDGQREEFDAVVLTVPAFAAAELLSPWAPAAAEPLGRINYASTAAVALAYPRDAVAHPLDGSGFLVPRAKARVITGCTWLSSKWPHTAPPGTALVRCFVGRAGSEEMLTLSDNQLIEAVDVDLRRYVDIGSAPVLARVYRWPRAMPQYEVGHLARVDAAEAAVAGYDTLALAGAGLRGLGVPDCIRQGREAAERVLAGCRRTRGG